MAEESDFVGVALKAAERLLKPPLLVRRGAALLYQVTVDNRLALTVDPKLPVRGDSAFQTDLCVFEQKSEGVVIPRVVLEFKTSITTHDVITYSAKARKHKQVYPYLRYGLVMSQVAAVPKRVFVHNESLDFAAAIQDATEAELNKFFTHLLSVEVAASKRLEDIAFGSLRPRLFRTEIQVDQHV
jgi:hypothetical protein